MSRRGKRVLLRDPVDSDFEFFHSWVSSDVVMQYVDWQTKDREESQRKFDEIARDRKSTDRKSFFFVVEDLASEKPIGECGFTLITEPPKTAELGYFFLPDFWGKGLAGEATQLVIEYGFSELGIGRFVAECMSRNTSSEKLMKRLGMEIECEFEKLLPRKALTVTKKRYSLSR